MKLKVTEKQPNSKMCFVCGLENEFGLKSSFYSLENGELMALFSPSAEHQGYPGRLHGGIAAAILDETMCRTVISHESGNLWGVTLDFSLKFRKPVPLDQEIRVVARITEMNRRTFDGSGEILLDDGSVAIEASGRFLKIDLSRITDFDFDSEQWLIKSADDDPHELER